MGAEYLAHRLCFAGKPGMHIFVECNHRPPTKIGPDQLSADPWLTPAGRVFAAVPNARSLHRQAGVVMGMLPCEDALNELDRHHGHQRVFNPESFRACFYETGLQIDIFGGYFLKPLSNRQLEEHWSAELVDAYLALGERYPDIASEIYVVAARRPAA